jgi:hypothetical protein
VEDTKQNRDAQEEDCEAFIRVAAGVIPVPQVAENNENNPRGERIAGKVTEAITAMQKEVLTMLEQRWEIMREIRNARMEEDAYDNNLTKENR